MPSTSSTSPVSAPDIYIYIYIERERERGREREREKLRESSHMFVNQDEARTIDVL